VGRIAGYAMRTNSRECVLLAVLLATGYARPLCFALKAALAVSDLLNTSDLRAALQSVADFLGRLAAVVGPAGILAPSIRKIIEAMIAIKEILILLDELLWRLAEVEELRPLIEQVCNGGTEDG
jgi:NAD(P)-dependent dehydrogenase (short-subunit alcohol dehydrogenase family)